MTDSHKWLERLVIIGIVLDLGISAVLVGQYQALQSAQSRANAAQARASANQQKVNAISLMAGCWDHVLNDAVDGKPQSQLLAEARACRG